MKRIALILVLLVTIISTSGCWDTQNIEDNDYVNAIGIDYDKGHYTVYLQLLEFGNIAKQEGPRPSTSSPVWVAEGTGETINLAVNKIYETTQERLYWGHVSALLFTQKAAKKGIEPIYDVFNRYREIRYDVWNFATNDDIQQIFVATPLFSHSPLFSRLHMPLIPYSQKSIIYPIYFQKFMASYREPGFTSYLPVLTIDTSSWSKDSQPHPMLKSDGVFLFYHKNYLGHLRHSEIQGIRWLQHQTIRSPVYISKDKKWAATVVFNKPTSQIKASFKHGKPHFEIKVSANGTVNELLQNVPTDYLKKESTRLIKRDIKNTYAFGLKKHMDALNLQHSFYLKYTKKWKKMTEDDKKFPLSEDSLDVQVKVHIINSGKLKMFNEL